MHTKIDIPAK